jgi:hypothetical protein
MNVTDKLYTEWAWRSKTGTPSMNNPEDKAILDNLLSELVVQGPTKDDIIDYIKNAELDDKQIAKLYQRVSNFGNYRSIKSTMNKKGYGNLAKKYSIQIQQIIEDLPREDAEKFSTYLQDESNQATFPSSNHTGNLLETLKSKTGLSDATIRAVFFHTAQDEKKRGVGMGEIAMSLLFKNVSNTVGGKGDLSIDGGEFEIKGNGAKLGPKGGISSDAFINAYSKFGVQFDGGKFLYNDKKFNKSGIPYLISELFSKENKGDILKTTKDFLTGVVGLPADSRISKIDYSDPVSINRNVGLMHFIDYSNKEGFNHFMIHDFGSNKKITGGNTGKYIYVTGSPESMADGLAKLGVNFEKISWVLFRPRMGFATSYLGEDEE